VDNVEREKQMRAGQTGPNSGARVKHLVPVSRVRARARPAASGFDRRAPKLPHSSRPAPPGSKPLAAGVLWRVCALTFPAGATVLFILGRAGAEVARGE